MKTQARVVVVGGGVVGVSTLYHLAAKGWGEECMLLEQAELTSGSTWHAAGLLPLFNMSYSVGQLHKYSVQLYAGLEAETGQATGFKRVGNIRLAMNAERMDEYYQYAATARTIGVDIDFLSPEKVREIWPLCNTDGLVGALHHTEDGYLQPADLTQALAAGARARGAQIHRRTRVLDIRQLAGGEWQVQTDQGSVRCEHVVIATGSYARQTGAMVGLDLPVIPVQHQYIVTDAHPDLAARAAAGLPELGILRESDGAWYMRQEGNGLILGPYEQGAPCCYVDGPAEGCEYDLFPEDLDRLEPHIQAAMNRVPIFAECGIKQVYNGAIPFTPDGNPLIGPAWGLRNFWLNEGHTFGITAAGGAGWQLAEWIVEGEPGIDMLDVEPRRYGDYTTEDYVKARNEETYAHVFVIHYPDEERPAGRPLLTSPCYERLRDMGAVFGHKAGWERPNFFATEGMAQEDHWSFRRSRWFEATRREALHVHEQAGLLDMTPFAKCRISGPGAADWLDRLVANRLPRRGRIGLCHLLHGQGGVLSEFTITREADNRFYLVSAAAWERLDHDMLQRYLPDDDSVRFERLTHDLGVFVIAGPKARNLLQSLTDSDFSNAAFPFLSAREVELAGVPLLAMRVNYVGELGWELHHPIHRQNALFDALFAAGEAFNLKPFGIRAMDALRLEKSYRMIGTELSIEYSGHESAMDRFLHPDKGDFPGRDALLARREQGLNWRLVTLRVDDVTDADALGNNAITDNGKLVGRATSGGFGFRVNQSLALAMLKPEYERPGTALEIDILGQLYPATVVPESPFDPDNARLRS